MPGRWPGSSRRLSTLMQQTGRDALDGVAARPQSARIAARALRQPRADLSEPRRRTPAVLPLSERRLVRPVRRGRAVANDAAVCTSVLQLVGLRADMLRTGLGPQRRAHKVLRRANFVFLTLGVGCAVWLASKQGDVGIVLAVSRHAVRARSAAARARGRGAAGLHLVLGALGHADRGSHSASPMRVDRPPFEPGAFRLRVLRAAVQGRHRHLQARAPRGLWREQPGLPIGLHLAPTSTTIPRGTLICRATR
jgi:hypothetical protein